jgi:acyl phosphate:glycerol-3-phosphate acyltransferase
MTNVLRAAGKKAAAVSLILDIAKGALSVMFAWLIFYNTRTTFGTFFSLNETAKILAALAAVAGHTWSIYLKFKGGRGVATLMGGMAALYWPAAILGGVCIFGIGLRTKYMSLGSIIGAVSSAFLLAAFFVCKVAFLRASPPPLEYVIFALIGATFIYVMHRDNIMRLYNGTERRIGDKSKTKVSPSPDTSK